MSSPLSRMSPTNTTAARCVVFVCVLGASATPRSTAPSSCARATGAVSATAAANAAAAKAQPKWRSRPLERTELAEALPSPRRVHARRMAPKQDFPDTSFLTTLPEPRERLGSSDERFFLQIFPSTCKVRSELPIGLARAACGEQELSERYAGHTRLVGGRVFRLKLHVERPGLLEVSGAPGCVRLAEEVGCRFRSDA